VVQQHCRQSISLSQGRTTNHSKPCIPSNICQKGFPVTLSVCQYASQTSKIRTGCRSCTRSLAFSCLTALKTQKKKNPLLIIGRWWMVPDIFSVTLVEDVEELLRLQDFTPAQLARSPSHVSCIQACIILVWRQAYIHVDVHVLSNYPRWLCSK
jgi:hypothetical protein